MLKETNLHKCFEFLEELQINNSDSKSETFQKVATYIEKDLEKSLENVFHNENSDIHNFMFKTSSSLNWKCAGCLNDTLLIITNRALLDLQEDNLFNNLPEFQTFTNGIVIASVNGLRPYVHESILKHRCFLTSTPEVPLKISPNERIQRLNGSVRIFTEFLCNKQILLNNEIEFILLQFIAACYTLIFYVTNDSTLDSQQYPIADYHNFLDKVYNQCSSQLYFKYLLILKSIKEQPIEIQNLLHNDLMKRLVAPNGFSILCQNLLPIKNTAIDTEQPIWKRAEIIYNIVGHRGHSNEFTTKIIDEIFTFYTRCLVAGASDYNYRFACVGSLSKIYAKPSATHRKHIESYFVGQFDKLCKPIDLLTGCIIADDMELKQMIMINWTAFCAPTPIRLPTKMLINYLPFLFQLRNQLQMESMLQNQVNELIVQCLANRNNDQLKQLINAIVFEEYSSEMKCMHSRVLLKFDNKTQLHSVQIDSVNQEYDAATIFLNILKQSQHNVFIYNVFLQLLHNLKNCINIKTTTNSDLLDNFAELEIGLQQKFKHKLTTIYLLSELINYKPFHSQFNENPQEIHNILKMILEQKIIELKSKNHPATNDDSILIIILLIIREFLTKLNNDVALRDTLKQLKTFYNDSDNEIKQEINSMLQIIDGTTIPSSSEKHCDASAFELARRLCEESEPHLIVYGLMNFVKLLQGDKDAETLTNKHTILAIALHCLQNDESYVFLNCIKLLIVLVNELEVEVIDCIVAEYQNEDNSMDFRLKFGEVIVKVTEGLGPLAYKYKSELINCFLRGSSNKSDEYRTSSLSNLGTICKILSYQIHQFFEELMTVINSIAINDNYLPARRAAIMILSQLICGIDKIIDFQECLLPIYRTLKNILSTSDDKSSQIHANAAIDHLNDKIKEFLQPKNAMEKEIKIFGINDDDKDGGKRKKHILEIV